jgi:hypothetical protein
VTGDDWHLVGHCHLRRPTALLGGELAPGGFEVVSQHGAPTSYGHRGAGGPPVRQCG